MMKHLLVPLEGESVERLLPVIRRLDGMGVSEITLLRSEFPMVADEYAVVSETLLQEAKGLLEEVRGRLSGLQASVGTVARIGPATATILEVAEETKATLILVASGQRSRLTRMLFGGAVERLVQRSTIPLLTVPPPWTYEIAPSLPPDERPLRAILVPLDGERASRGILPHALDVAQTAGARLLLLSVLPGHDRGRSGFETAEEQLYAAGADCIAAGVDFSVVVESGNPAERILAACRNRDVDWIAMSTRGRSVLSRWFTPSTTLQVLRQSWVPTLTVRSDPAARPLGLESPGLLGRH
ncbi:MAG TPA: universal stress protein [Planctomycetota bacterium]|nr:universal stress protein [Planctomycetota bacterium]